MSEIPTNIIEAQRRITAALELLEHVGYKTGGDIVDDLYSVIKFLQEPRYTQTEALSLIRQCRVVATRQRDSHQPVVWLRLPVELRVLCSGDGLCDCERPGCKGKTGGATWDTLGIQLVRNEHPWTFHAPEAQ